LTSTAGKRNESFHLPVLAEEVVKLLVTRPDGTYADLTCGGGGHMKYVSGALSEKAILVGVDRDSDAISAVLENLKSIPQEFKVFNLTFARLEDMAEKSGIGQFDGFLIDLGVSSHQINTPYRGFSFMHDGPLDMKMGFESKRSALEIINYSSERELISIFREFGEEKKAGRCGRAIIQAREKHQIKTTFQLVEILRPVLPFRELNSSLARIFQAIRITVNDELNQLKEVLSKVLSYLTVGGRLVVISYHSLEDRIVKRFMMGKAKGCICPPNFPVCACNKKPEVKILTKKAVRPLEEEIMMNIRARSARLRAVEKLG
jgi:16S rRNA (cytosine1402-N4)-methyltransferase